MHSVGSACRDRSTSHRSRVNCAVVSDHTLLTHALVPSPRFLLTVVAGLRSQLDGAVAGGTVSEERGSVLYTQWHASVASLQSLLNASVTGLPPYDVRKAQTAVDALGLAVEETRGRILPRKKFTFSKRRPPHTQAATSSADGAVDKPPAESANAATASTGGAALSSASAGNMNSEEEGEREDEYTIRDRVDEVIVVTPAALQAHMRAKQQKQQQGSSNSSAASFDDAGGSFSGDLRLLNLTRCCVMLLAPLRALRIDQLSHCVVLSGPVAGSLLLHDCNDCTVMVPSRQVRLHRSTGCDMYLRPCSRPIIEHCTQLRFGPCGLNYPGFEAHLRSSGLGQALAAAEGKMLAAAALPPQPASTTESTSTALGAAATGGSSFPLWRSVDDFGWLRVQASPNWSALPQEQWIRSGSSSRSSSRSSGFEANDCLSAEGLSSSLPADLKLGACLVALPDAAAQRGLTVSYAGQAWIGEAVPDRTSAAAVVVVTSLAADASSIPSAVPTADSHDDDEL